jgi:IclR family pca regulon transcriptional regulator
MTDFQPDYFVKSVEKAFAVLLAFSAEQPRLTMSQVATKVHVSRATARRFLLTLADLGYLRADEGAFEMTPRCLDLGASFLSSLSLPQIAEPHLKALSTQLSETTSLCVLDGPDIVYVARVASPRLLSVSINVGTRFPAWITSMGRVLIAGLSPIEREAYFEAVTLQHYTARSIATMDELRAEIDKVARNGWAIVSEELEDGLRGVAVPVWRNNRVVAAVNVSLQAYRASPDMVEATVIPLLQEAARLIGDDFGGTVKVARV